MIGVFDSGLGGLSLLPALIDALPHADFTYVADTAHVPYGDKDDGFIQRRVLAIGNQLALDGARALVVACNTATAAAVQALREAHPELPVIGIEPGIKPAAASSTTRRIAVLATPSTARSFRLRQLIERHAAGIDVIVEPCPDWATHVETLRLEDPGLDADIAERIGRLLDLGADRIVLGCTHYSFLARRIAPRLLDRARLVEVAPAVAAQTRRMAHHAGRGAGRLSLYATARPERLQAALPVLGLASLAPRLAGPARLFSAG